MEPLEQAIVDAIKAGEIKTEGKIKDPKALAKQLQDLGMDRDEAKGVVCFKNNNVFLDVTKGIQYLNETIELCKQAFDEAMDRRSIGPGEGHGHEDHAWSMPSCTRIASTVGRRRSSRPPASGIYGAMCQAERILLEPITKIFINVPQDMMGDATRELQSRRSTIEDITSEGDAAVIVAQAPVAEMFGFASAIRGATQGRALWSTENAGFVQVADRDSDQGGGRDPQAQGTEPRAL